MYGSGQLGKSSGDLYFVSRFLCDRWETRLFLGCVEILPVRLLCDERIRANILGVMVVFGFCVSYLQGQL